MTKFLDKIHFYSLVITFFAYFFAGKLALFLAIPPGYISPILPSVGINLICVLFFGNRACFSVFLASFLIHLQILLSHLTIPLDFYSISASLVLSLGPVFQGMLGALLIRRTIGFPNDLIRFRDILMLLGLGVGVISVMGSFWSIVVLYFYPEKVTLPLEKQI